MDAIDDFKICIDLGDRDRLHDYVSGQTRTRSSFGMWDRESFRGLGMVESVPKDDENKQLLVGLLDNALLDKSLLEKKMKKGDEAKEGNKEEEIFGSSFDADVQGDDLPPRVLPFYKPGEVVKGHVVLKLSKELQLEKVCLEFLGEAACNIRVYHRYGYYDDTFKQKYVEEERVLWRKISKESGDFELSDISSRHSGGPAPSKVLPPGNHRFGFDFTVPADAGQSMPPLVHSTTNYVRLVYRLKATVKFGNTFGRGNIVTHKGVWILKDFDINSEPDKLQPVSSENTLDTGAFPFWKSGKMHVRAELPRAAYVKGEPVPISIEIDNMTGGEIVQVKARVILQGKTRTGKMHLSKTIRLKSRKVMEGPIAAGMSPVFNWELPWDFSHSSVDSALLPVGKLDDSQYIEIEYGVFIKIKRKGLHRNMDMYIPITIGTEDTSGKASVGLPVFKKSAASSMYPSLE